METESPLVPPYEGGKDKPKPMIFGLNGHSLTFVKGELERDFDKTKK